MTLTLETSGVVIVPTDDPNYIGERWLTWESLSPFAQGYVKELFAAFRAEPECDGCPGLWPDDDLDPALRCCHEVRFSDLSPETLAMILADCEAFGRAVGKDPAHNAGLGRRFYESRQSGFSTLWSLHQAEFAAAFPRLTVSLGDDGKVRLAVAS